MKHKPQIVSIHNPADGTWKSYKLKHWHGKRVNYQHRYAKIVAAQNDRDLNFVHWWLSVPDVGHYVRLYDPNYRP